MTPKAQRIAVRLRSLANESQQYATIQQLRQQLEREPSILKAKWLDPKCWKGCQSLVIKGELQQLRQQLEELRENHRLLHRDYSITSERLGVAENKLQQAEADTEFWMQMFERARCGCFTLDCTKHGSYSYKDVERVNAAIDAAKSK